MVGLWNGLKSGRMGYESGFIENRRGKRLFYVKEGPSDASSGWIFCNPFFEEKLFTQRVYRNFARTLAGLGCAVLRFDYEGDGDSEGDVESIGLQDRVNDLEDAYIFLRGKSPVRSVGLFGLRLGGTVALLGARALGAREVLAWSPVVDGSQTFHELIRFNLTTQLGAYRKIVTSAAEIVATWEGGGTVPVLGHDIGSRLVLDLRGLSLVGGAASPGCPCRVIAFSEKMAGVPDAWNAVTRVVPVAPFWHEPTRHDPHQQALVDASLAMIRESGGEVA